MFRNSLLAVLQPGTSRCSQRILLVGRSAGGRASRLCCRQQNYLSSSFWAISATPLLIFEIKTCLKTLSCDPWHHGHSKSRSEGWGASLSDYFGSIPTCNPWLGRSTWSIDDSDCPTAILLFELHTEGWQAKLSSDVVLVPIMASARRAPSAPPR